MVMVLNLQGGRIVLDKWCEDGRCTRDPSTKSGYAENPDGTVKFNPGMDAHGNQLTITQFLEQHPDWESPMGGHQGGKGVVGLLRVTIDYQKGSLFDNVAEFYAGTHDMLNSVLWYDSNGNAKDLDGMVKGVGEAFNYVNVGLATPFALSTLLPPEVWDTIMVGIQNAR